MELILAFGVLAAAALAALLPPLLRRRPPLAPRAGYDLHVYREQLRELGADLERGLITPDQERAARTEIERRILAAGAENGADPTPAHEGRMRRAVPVAMVLAAPAAAAAVYLAIGNPTIPDQPLAERPRALEPGTTNPDMEQAVAQLAARLKEEPDDLDGWVLLARSYAFSARYEAAISAYREAAALAPEDNDIASALGEAIVYRNDGVVTPAARQQFEAVLGRDPAHQVALYFTGLDHIQAGESARALSIWRRLAEEADPEQPWLPALREQLRALAEEMGVPVPDVALVEAPPPERAAPGPDEADMAAAAEMTADDRMAMIRGMVARLETRLGQEPGDLQGWKRLANAKRVLDEHEGARDAYARAAALAPDDPVVLGDYAMAEIAVADPETPIPDAAVAAFGRLLDLDPTHIDALWFLGLAAEGAGRADEAAEFWRRLLALLPADGTEAEQLSRRIDGLEDDG